MTVLVTDGDNRAALAVTRSLGRAGHKVIVAAPRRGALAHASRYCDRRLICPNPVSEPDRFVDAIVEQVRALHIDVVMPISDVTTFLVTGARERFGTSCAVPFASADVIDRAADKVDIVQTAIRLGVPVPRSIVVHEADALPANGLEFPMVIKPCRSRVRTGAGFASTSVSYAGDLESLKRDLNARPQYEFPVMLQERIEGPGIGVFTCYHRGQPVALFSHRRVRERPPWGGVSVLSESVPMPALARDYATSLLGAIDWTGVAMVEFKVDQRDLQPKLMEINGRFWGSLQLAIDAGVDFPVILLQTLLPEGTAPQLPYRIGVRDRWLWGDFDSLLQTLFRRSHAPAFATPSRPTALLQFLDVWRPNLYYDNPKWDDTWPFVRETVDRLRFIR